MVNTSRFTLFFPEKRQFFTESAGIFDYGRASGSAQERGSGLLPIFYSRSIGLDDTGREVPLIGGARIAGRTGKFQIGLMNVETDEATFHSGATDLVVPRANYTVVRAKRNILSKSSIGGMFLNRQGSAGTSNEFNRVVGADLGLTFGSSTIITGMLAKTFTPDTRGKDTAGVLDLGYKVDAFNGGLTYIDVAEKFNAEMGYIPRVDIRNPSFSSAWTPRPKWRGVRQVTLGVEGDYFENHAGQVESRTGSATFSIERQDGARFSTSLTHDYDFVPSAWAISPGRKVPAGEYTWDSFNMSYSVNSNKPVYGSASVSLGGYYGGTKRTPQVKFNVVTLGTLLFENVYTRNDISLPGYATYATTVLSTRLSYSFSPDLFVKSFVQYNNDRRMASLNFLLWYVYRPGSDLYVVYNGGWETDVPGPRDIRPRSRSLAIKMTYWLAR